MRHFYRISIVAMVLFMTVALVGSAVQAAASTSKPKYIVRAVAVDGLHSVPEKTVLDQVKKTTIGSEFSEDNVREDMQAIMSTGYFSDVEARLAPQDDGVKVIFTVVENEKVKSIRIETSLLDPVTIRSYIRQKEGEVLNERLLEEDLQNLQDKIIEDHGYVMRPTDVSMTPEGDVVIVVTPARVAKVVITGNVETRNKVIERELKMKAGDYLNMKTLGDDLRRLWHLGFFDEVKPEFKDGENPDEIVVNIDVVERKTGLFGFGGGYSTADGLLGYLEFSDPNFLGRGESFNIRSEWAQRKVSYEFGFTEPYLLGSRASLGFSLYNTNTDMSRLNDDDEDEISDYSDYKEWKKGGTLAIGRPFGNYTQGSVKLKIEDSSIEPIGESSTVEASSSKTRSFILQTTTDTTGDPYYPTDGMRLNLSAELAGTFLGGDTPFAKYTGQYSKYFTVGRNNQVLAFQLVGGMAPDSLPLQEEFRIGGANTLRGYSYGEMTGNSTVYLNSEYRFKLTKELQAVLFVDGGQAWDNTKSSAPGMKWGYGLGLRIQTPLGIMRLDYGIGEKGGQAYFSLGPAF